MVNEKPFIERLRKAYNKTLSDGEVLDLVYDRVIKILEEVDEYMTDPDTLFSTAEYNFKHGKMEACNEVMRVLEDNEEYDYIEVNYPENNTSPEDLEHPFVDEEKERRAGFFDE